MNYGALNRILKSAITAVDSDAIYISEGVTGLNKLKVNKSSVFVKGNITTSDSKLDGFTRIRTYNCRFFVLLPDSHSDNTGTDEIIYAAATNSDLFINNIVKQGVVVNSSSITNEVRRETVSVLSGVELTFSITVQA